jgi:hypothetical protein
MPYSAILHLPAQRPEGLSLAALTAAIRLRWPAARQPDIDHLRLTSTAATQPYARGQVSAGGPHHGLPPCCWPLSSPGLFVGRGGNGGSIAQKIHVAYPARHRGWETLLGDVLEAQSSATAAIVGVLAACSHCFSTTSRHFCLVPKLLMDYCNAISIYEVPFLVSMAGRSSS